DSGGLPSETTVEHPYSLLAADQLSLTNCPGIAAPSGYKLFRRARSLVSLALAVRSLSGQTGRERELMDASKLAPLAHNHVEVFIKGSSVRRVTDAFSPFRGWQVEVGSLFGIRIIADLRDDLALFIQYSHSALQLREDGVIAANVNGRGHPQIFLNDFYKIPLEVPIFDAIVVTIADQQQGLALTRIQGDAVAGVELSFLRARRKESSTPA